MGCIWEVAGNQKPQIQMEPKGLKAKWQTLKKIRWEYEYVYSPERVITFSTMKYMGIGVDWATLVPSLWWIFTLGLPGLLFAGVVFAGGAVLILCLDFVRRLRGEFSK